MGKPFEGIFGNNCELRIIEFLLPLKEMEFNISELAEEVGISRPTATKVINKFVERDIMKKSNKRGGTCYYEINSESPFVRVFENLNNVIIEQLLDEETLYKIHDQMKIQVQSKKPLEEEKVEPAFEIESLTEHGIHWLEPEERCEITYPFGRGREQAIYGGDLNVAG